jgi:hypothetical protein
MEPGDTAEFAFTKEMPKREKSKWENFWEVFKEMKSLQATEGMLIPLPLAAHLCNLSRQRVVEIAEDGRLKRVMIHSHAYITENSMVEFLKTVRGPGIRPQVAGRDVADSVMGQAGQAAGVAFKMMKDHRARRKAAKQIR